MLNITLENTPFIDQINKLRDDIVMPTGTGLYSQVVAILKQYKMKNEIARNLKAGKVFSIVKYWETMNVPPIENIPDPTSFPKLQERLDGFSKAITEYAKEKKATKLKPVKVTIAIGDSLTDFFRKYSAHIDPRLNFGIAGTCSSHFKLILQYVLPLLEKNNLIIENLLIGSFIGNALLGHQKYENAIADAKDVIYFARQNLPTTKFLLYGLPPVFDIYAMSFQQLARDFFIAIMNEDKNAVYLDIFDSFSGAFGIMPKAEYSLEGVHMTPLGKYVYDEMIGLGLLAVPGSVIIKRK